MYIENLIYETSISEIKKIYEDIKDEIVSRLEDFKLNFNDDYRIFSELVFCLLTPQSKAKICWRAVEGIMAKNLLFKDNVSKEDLTNENLNAFGISMVMDKYPTIQRIFKKIESALEMPFMATVNYIMDEYEAGFLSNFQHEERFLFFFTKKKEQDLFVDDKATFGQLTKKLVYTIIENFKVFFKNLFDVLKNSIDIASIPLDTVIKFAKQFNFSFIKSFKKVKVV